MREEVQRQLRETLDEQVAIANIGNLRIDSIRVALRYPADGDEYGFSPYTTTQPAVDKELSIAVEVNEEKAEEFAADVNQGKVPFLITYSFNGVGLNSYQFRLRAKSILNTSIIQNLKESGVSVLTERQFSYAAKNIRASIVAEEVEGLRGQGGSIDPPSLSVSDVLSVFKLDDIAIWSQRRIKVFEERIAERFDPDIDKSKFQPFQIQKQVLDSSTASKR